MKRFGVVVLALLVLPAGAAKVYGEWVETDLTLADAHASSPGAVGASGPFDTALTGTQAQLEILTSAKRTQCLQQAENTCAGGAEQRPPERFDLGTASVVGAQLAFELEDVQLTTPRAVLAGKDGRVLSEGVLALAGSGVATFAAGTLTVDGGDYRLGENWERRADQLYDLVVRTAVATGPVALTNVPQADLDLPLTVDRATVYAEGRRVDAGFTVTDAEPGRMFIEADVPLTGAAVPPIQDQTPDSGLVLAGLAALVLGAIAGFAYWPLISFTFTALGLPMYSRITHGELLDHGARQALVDAIRDEPGVHPHALSEKLGLGWGTVVYHLRRLERERVVVSRRIGRYRRYFPSGGYTEVRKQVLALLQNETSRSVAQHVLEHPGHTQSDVAGALGLSPSLVNWHVNRLTDAGLVKVERDGRSVRYHPGEAWLELTQVAA